MTPEQLTIILNAIESLRPEKVRYCLDDGIEIITTDPIAADSFIKWVKDCGKPTDWDAKVAHLYKCLEIVEKREQDIHGRCGLFCRAKKETK